MGGYGAIRLGLKYPDRFASIFGHSSFLPNAEEWAAWSADWGWWSASFRAALRAEGNAYDWAARLDPLHAPRQVAALLCNQRSRIAAAAWLRDQAPAVQSWFAPEGPRRYGFVPVRRDRREATTVHRRCGRAEVRHLIASAEVAGVLDWPVPGARVAADPRVGTPGASGAGDPLGALPWRAASQARRLLSLS